MKYRVSYYIDNAAQYKGEMPHSEISECLDDYTVAISAEELVSLAASYIAEETGGEEVNGEVIVRDDDGEVVECFYGFYAEEIKEEKR